MNRFDFKKKISEGIKIAVKSVYKEVSKDLIDEIELTVPNARKYGDFSTNFCLVVSKKLNQPSNKVAQSIKTSLDEIVRQGELKDYIRQIKIGGTGFLNFYISENLKATWLEDIYKEKYFNQVKTVRKEKRISIEFVSANPTGPLTIAHARQAVVGDCLANLYEFCGYKVTREYYINDEGRQVELLGKSVKARCRQLLNMKSNFPAEGYKGKYVIDIARKLLGSLSKEKIRKDIYSVEVYSTKAIKIIMDKIKYDLENLGVSFNKWPKQSQITKSKKMEQLLKQLQAQGYLYRKNQALWFKTTLLGDTKDRTLIKKNGQYTYFAPDIVYHDNKLTHNNRVINVWGPDHHGYIPRIKAAVEAMGYNPNSITILIVQLTTVYKKGKPLSMSKRKGEFISLEDILKLVGKDVTRFFLLMRKLDSHLDFDLELAKKTSINNPVFYLQYAHARICSIMEKATHRFDGNNLHNKLNSLNSIELTNLDAQIEKEIISKLLRFPDEILICLESLEPYRLVSYLQELVSDFHKYYADKRVLLEDEKLTLSRLYLCECVRKTLKQGLELLGIQAPERM